MEQCYKNPCPAFDEEACVANGGLITTTDDGCCMKCQSNECYECDRRVSTSAEYLVLENECASTEPVLMSYCDGFCRGSYFWSPEGPDNQCSCCNPTTTVMRSTTLKCKNGTEVEYQYEDVLSCGCSATCSPDVKPTPPVEVPPDFTTRPPKPTPEVTTEVIEISASGSGSGLGSGSGEESGESGEDENGIVITIPEAPITTVPTTPKPIPTTTATTTTPTSTTTPTTTTTTTKVEVACRWSNWINSDRPKAPHLDDNETYAHIREAGLELCQRPLKIECREVISKFDEKNTKDIKSWNQVTTCDVDEGFLCLSRDQPMHPVCLDYEIRVFCCGAVESEHGSNSGRAAEAE